MSKNQTNEYWREYRRRNLEKKRLIEKKCRQSPEFRARKREYMRKWTSKDRALNPHKWIARSRVKEALKQGTLVRLPCEICGNPKSEAHHEDHHKPLEIRWLCRIHHMQRDNTFDKQIIIIK